VRSWYGSLDLVNLTQRLDLWGLNMAMVRRGKSKAKKTDTQEDKGTRENHAKGSSGRISLDNQMVGPDSRRVLCVYYSGRFAVCVHKSADDPVHVFRGTQAWRCGSAVG